MLPLWVIISLAAALSQTARNAGQKHLATTMSVWGATLVRFAFGLPFALIYLWGAGEAREVALPDIHLEFVLWCAATAAAQIGGTVALVSLYAHRNFAVGSSFARTETISTAIIGASLFGERIGFAGWLAVLISSSGVILISVARQGVGLGSLIASAFNRVAGVGILSGVGFALSSLTLREASLSLNDSDYFTTAAMTLVTVIVIEVIGLGLFIKLRTPTDFAAMARAWKWCVFVGLASALGSAGWFTAMTIEKVSYVKIVAQIEFLFSILVSIWIFKERSSLRELVGMTLIAAGLVVLLAFEA